jgi:hypothetical protein
MAPQEIRQTAIFAVDAPINQAPAIRIPGKSTRLTLNGMGAKRCRGSVKFCFCSERPLRSALCNAQVVTQVAGRRVVVYLKVDLRNIPLLDIGTWGHDLAVRSHFRAH